MYANSEADQINHFFAVTSLHFCDNYWHKEVLIILKKLSHEIVWNVKITTSLKTLKEGINRIIIQ